MHLRIVERFLRREEQRLGRSDAVDDRSWLVQSDRQRTDDVIVTADRDDRTAGQSRLGKYVRPDRAERRAGRRDRRGKVRLEVRERQQLLRPAMPVDVEIERAGGERRIGRRLARETEGDPVGHHQNAARGAEGVRPVLAHPESLLSGRSDRSRAR